MQNHINVTWSVVSIHTHTPDRRYFSMYRNHAVNALHRPRLCRTCSLLASWLLTAMSTGNSMHKTLWHDACKH